ncbi:PREDICTED: uncharacterized CRM domain-containing protein At3g25440, chloroplastic [Tarenaya hassleriana]|uniref:uncharacterized CRM domain-containing protein At3g25440, chloroplastic n=1 Tax=Tarenaya hassleriana TaxID=28532 RepID=UPI00053C260B|nr:PREDICTED: uncharacterized CRM domain-containing protein At3g25440, chloroplastic [Tarenaya hassleriana]XP_010554069.1 PREDICTED: uncharacterized CRM domain-containing protein At3g25440, chloroplastic [Tarenaya hassleriana]
MFASRNLLRRCSRSHLWSSSSVLQSDSFRNPVLLKEASTNLIPRNGMQPSSSCEGSSSSFPFFVYHPFRGWARAMSTSRGRSMRSKVESRMRKESGKTLREIRRAKKLKKKLMTDEERLIYNIKRAKKKVALLLQKLKKYELPELPSPVHDPELFTAEQLQAYKKVGFKNKNYVPVGVRGVFGGVVQNMHLHWKFHETVQVCCDNFPKEKIKEMASMLARLSGGIVINVHNVKTIIMFRGRNYRQPKNLIPVNTLTKRKALFKARFEQALESQKLNIKKIEQQLRRMGVNPEDPVAMASIQRVASTFFNAIDRKEGTPYIFHGDKQPEQRPSVSREESEPGDDSDQEELDRFIAEIEDAADKEWAAEEAAEKEEYGRIRYWNREEFNGRTTGSDRHRYGPDDRSIGGSRGRNEMDARMKRTSDGSDDDDDDDDDDGGGGGGGGGGWDSDDGDEDGELPHKFDRARTNRGRQREEFKRRGSDLRVRQNENVSESETMFSDLDNTMWDSEDENDDKPKPRFSRDDYKSTRDEDEDAYSYDERHRKESEYKKPSYRNGGSVNHKNDRKPRTGKQRDEDWDSD